MKNEALLEVNSLHVSAGEKEILHGVDLTVGRDETHVLMGPNGTGKSTLGYAVTGNPVYTVTSGSIVFDGEDELDEQIKALEAIIPQGYSEENYIKAKSAYDNAYKEQQKLPQLREELHEINVQLDMAEQENKIISEKLIEARENYSSLAAQYKSACAQMEKDAPFY